MLIDPGIKIPLILREKLFLCMLRSLLSAALFFISVASFGQGFLNRTISITATREPVSSVLSKIGQKGGFNFSYNSDILPADSLVTLYVQNKSVRHVLDLFLMGSYQYKETSGYVIIQRPTRERSLYVNGMILDAESGERVDYASVYSKVMLVSAMSNTEGGFRLRLREGSLPVTLTVSKIGYSDTVVIVRGEEAQDLKIVLAPKVIELDQVTIRHTDADHNWLARLFVSSRLRIQSRNIGEFFVALPYQASIMPGLGTHGRMGGQVTNRVSLNILGGYTGGVNGVEVAGFFNLSKNNVRYVQVAGLFNVVEGEVSGFQAAGLYNKVLDSLVGVQVSGLWGVTSRGVNGAQASGVFSRSGGVVSGGQLGGLASIGTSDFKGFQASGIYGSVYGHLRGVQLAGVLSRVRGETDGAQVSGILSYSGGRHRGVQVGVVNYAGDLKGFQIGLINMSERSSGYSLGLINIVKYGKKEMAVHANEMTPVNLSWKSGNRRFYSMLTGGTDLATLHTFGLGLGSEFSLGRNLDMNAEFSRNYFIFDKDPHFQEVDRLQTSLLVKLGRHFLLSAGPSVNAMFIRSGDHQSRFERIARGRWYEKDLQRFHTWLGWQGGVHFSF